MSTMIDTMHATVMPPLDDRFTITTLRPGGVVERHERIGFSRSTYVLRGPCAAVQARVDALFAEYPPEGYGTRAEVLAAQSGGDEVLVRVTHAASCD